MDKVVGSYRQDLKLVGERNGRYSRCYIVCISSRVLIVGMMYVLIGAG